MLKAFQIRAARSATGIGVRDIGLYLKVSRTIISRWEQQMPLSEIKSNATDPNSLKFFFKQHGISFPDTSSIVLDVSDASEFQTKSLTRFQLRAARAALCLSQKDLATLTSIPQKIINYLENQDNTTILNSPPKNVDDSVLRSFFEENGIVFKGNFCISLTKNIKFGE